jgi:hypothetical protein
MELNPSEPFVIGINTNSAGRGEGGGRCGELGIMMQSGGCWKEVISIGGGRLNLVLTN